MEYVKKIQKLSIILNDIVYEGRLPLTLRVLVEIYLYDIYSLFHDLENDKNTEIAELMHERNKWESEYDKCQLHIENMELEIKDLEKQVNNLEKELNGH